jgi:hypothetical protein
MNDTLLRRIDPNDVNTQSLITVIPSAVHPYQSHEAMRKIMNNTTTVSHTFAVWMTVGYFEVPDRDASGNTIQNPAPSGVPGVPDFVRLGKEYYKEVPGDTRHKFFAIVDRSNVALVADPRPAPNGQLPTGSTNQHARVRPFFTTVEATAAAGTNQIQIATPGPAAGQFYVDGNLVAIDPNDPQRNRLVIGTGANQEVVVVSPTGMTFNAATGVTTFTISGVVAPTVSPTLTKNHAIGECVSNVRPGNPGPQWGYPSTGPDPNFDVDSPMYQPIVPHYSRITQ